MLGSVNSRCVRIFSPGESAETRGGFGGFPELETSTSNMGVGKHHYTAIVKCCEAGIVLSIHIEFDQ